LGGNGDGFVANGSRTPGLAPATWRALGPAALLRRLAETGAALREAKPGRPM